MILTHLSILSVMPFTLGISRVTIVSLMACIHDKASDFTEAASWWELTHMNSTDLVFGIVSIFVATYSHPA